MIDTAGKKRAAAAPAGRARTGRPRDEAARAAILKAADAILEEKGIGGFTIEAVAACARVAKTTIYRWWPSKGALAMAGFLAETAPKISYPNSGEYRLVVTAKPSIHLILGSTCFSSDIRAI